MNGRKVLYLETFHVRQTIQQHGRIKWTAKRQASINEDDLVQKRIKY